MFARSLTINKSSTTLLGCHPEDLQKVAISTTPMWVRLVGTYLYSLDQKLFCQLRNARKSREYSPSVSFFIRRTGITLREGKLDEHGMEEIEGIFSSPEKSPVKINGHGYGNDTLNSEDMETGDSTFLHCHHMGPIIFATQNGISYTHFPSR